ncbi:uncharacterized protein LOC34621827 [Cyclospora cayetanensis]|uniref:Uncharacterized protein LOC34621827 n=1 Tax=Cyclospora cayetanensis TaxID=88456 RepID=A0A6P6RPJ8_9EIME|nr:uncharacterized protein LOC34621827 [Cyclospora cayetanensis]
MIAKLTLLSLTVPTLLLVMPLIAYVLLRTASKLRAAIRSLKRLETVARSPLHCLLAGAVGGGATLRAFRAERRYFDRCVAALLLYGNTSYLNTCLQAWLALRLQLIGASLQALLLAAVALPLYFWPERLEQVRGEMAGLMALSLYSVSPLVRLLTQSITTFVRLEVQMVSVERIRDYLLVPAEDPNYDVITGLPWHPITSKPAAPSSSWLPWLSWRRRLKKDAKTTQLPVFVDNEEQQPLLKQRRQPETCPDCSEPRALLYLGALSSPPPPAFRRSAAAAAGALAVHETLACLRGRGGPLSASFAVGDLCTKGTMNKQLSTPFPDSVSLGFRTRGRIDFENVTVAYSSCSPPAVRGVSLTIHPGEAVGIVGRTGAGKSTLLLALTRMVPYTGVIKIDGVDIQKLPVHVLRSRLAYVPQVPTLFSGTIRSNLDPVGARTDAELFEALRLCRLDQVVKALPQALDTPIATVDEASSVEFRIRRSRRIQGGTRVRLASPTMASSAQHEEGAVQPRRREVSPFLAREGPMGSAALMTPPVHERPWNRGNSKPSGGGGSQSIRLSIGQKQLLCFCRAILRDAPILCLDEANSAMDSSVEEEVLVPVIKWCLRRGSVLIVSHRLQHLPSLCHRVGVVGEGQLLEFAPPRSLLKDKTSRFHALYLASRASPGSSPSS